MVKAREERNSRALVVTGEGREGDGVFQYSGTETGDTRVGGVWMGVGGSG